MILATDEKRMEHRFGLSKMSPGFRFRVCSVFNPWLLAVSPPGESAEKSDAASHYTPSTNSG
jgi:hypothetical protein